MKCMKGEMFQQLTPTTVLLVTTNGVLKDSGDLVMGAGSARKMKEYWTRAPEQFGDMIREFGRQYMEGYWHYGLLVYKHLGILQTKLHWNKPSPIEIVAYSLGMLHVLAKKNPLNTYRIPRPGCGHGGLSWDQVFPLVGQLPENVQVWTHA